MRFRGGLSARRRSSIPVLAARRPGIELTTVELQVHVQRPKHSTTEQSISAKSGVYTVSQKKTVQISFCQNFVKFPPISVIFGRKMKKRLKLYKMHSTSTSSNSHHHTTVLNADVPNCYTMLKVVIFNKLSSDLISTQ